MSWFATYCDNLSRSARAVAARRRSCEQRESAVAPSPARRSSAAEYAGRLGSHRRTGPPCRRSWFGRAESACRCEARAPTEPRPPTTRRRYERKAPLSRGPIAARRRRQKRPVDESPSRGRRRARSGLSRPGRGSGRRARPSGETSAVPTAMSCTTADSTPSEGSNVSTLSRP